MSVLILGGRGLVGNYISELLIEKENVIVVDNLSSHQHLSQRKKNINNNIIKNLTKSNNYTFIEADVKNTSDLLEIIKKYKPEKIIYLAALLASESTSYPNEAYETIYKAPKNLLEALKREKIRIKFLYASSSFVYGDFKDNKLEEDAKKPVDTYGEMKLKFENYISKYSTTYIDWNIIRPSSVYGIGDPRERYASTCIEDAFYDNKVEIHYPNYICDFTYVKDLARIFDLVLSSNCKSEIFNATYGEARTNLEFVDCLKEYYPDLTVINKNLDDSKFPKRGALNSQKAYRLLGWKAEYDIKRGIEDTIKILGEMNNGI